jgi:hypothetical protein
VIDFGLKTDFGHFLGVAGREFDFELDDGAVVNALFHEVHTVPFSKAMIGARQYKYPDWCELLKQSIFQHQSFVSHRVMIISIV